jgi:mannose-6-phosphate isomerase-like protein (cupin superfamily)
MDVKKYIESGIVQDYCLGMLSKKEMQQVDQHAANHPEIKNEMEAHQKLLGQYAGSFAKTVPPELRAKTLSLLDNLKKEELADLNNLPLLNKFSDHKNWLRVVKPLLPAVLKKPTFAKVLHEDDKVLQVLLWVKDYYPDEVHDDLNECFIVLEGECECHVEDEIIKLGAGGFFEVPLHKHHDVVVTKGPVLAVVQRLKVA